MKINHKLTYFYRYNIPPADPNVRLLITNGGLLSIYEAIYFKKPLIGMPLFGDQFQNIALVEQHGIGRALNVDNITVEAFAEILDDVRSNPVYQQNIDRLHELMFVASPTRDKLEQAMAHIEYVIATKGAAHLRAPALALSVWQLYLVDVSAALVLIVFLVLAVPAAVIGVILRRANARIGGAEGETCGQLKQRSSSWEDRDDVRVPTTNRSPKSSVPSTPTEPKGMVVSGGGATTLKKHN